MHDPQEILQEVERLHQEIDLAAAKLVSLLGARLRCRPGCQACCMDGMTVFEVEAAIIRHHFPSLLLTGTPHPEGACAFLDQDGNCRIYAHRPYVCRTQGLPLRWIEEDEEGNLFEMRDICPENEEGEPVEQLPDELCWAIGPFEERLAGLQMLVDNDSMRRASLRSLFREKPS
jgi:uncharacterized protein